MNRMVLSAHCYRFNHSPKANCLWRSHGNTARLGKLQQELGNASKVGYEVHSPAALSMEVQELGLYLSIDPVKSLLCTSITFRQVFRKH